MTMAEEVEGPVDTMGKACVASVLVSPCSVKSALSKQQAGNEQRVRGAAAGLDGALVEDGNVLRATTGQLIVSPWIFWVPDDSFYTARQILSVCCLHRQLLSMTNSLPSCIEAAVRHSQCPAQTDHSCVRTPCAGGASL
jgi:hypothetical protein